MTVHYHRLRAGRGAGSGYLVLTPVGVWHMGEAGILAWSRQIDSDWLTLAAQPERAAGVGSPGDGELRTPPGGGSPCPLGLDAFRDIRRTG